MQNNKTQKCTACGSPVVVLEHQTRAADEPQTMIETCSKCPLNANAMKGALSPPPLPLRHALQHRRTPSNTLNSTPVSETKTCVLTFFFSGSVPEEFRCKMSDHYITPCAVSSRTRPHTPVVVDYHHTGLYSHCTRELESTKDVGLGFKVETLKVVRYPGPVQDVRVMLNGLYGSVLTSNGSTVWLYTTTYGDRERHHLEVDVTNVNLGDVLSEVLSMSMCHSNVYSVLDKGFVRSLRNTAPRAWDAPTKDYPNHVYTAKVDGERSWCVVHKSLAMHFKCGNGQDNVGRYPWGWHVLDRPYPAQKPVVIDTENCGSYGVVFIDMLTDLDGNVSPHNRRIGEVVQQINSLHIKRTGLCIRVRGYFSSLEKAKRYTTLLSTPTDGILAIEKSGVTAKKLKAFKSVELLVGADFKLYTQDGVLALGEPHLCPRSKPGDVVEVRFKKSTKRGFLSVSEVFNRPDKALANTAEAFSSILDSSGSVKVSDDGERRKALLWCNVLRGELFRLATLENNNKLIVMNIGAGSGQAVDELSTSGDVSVLHIEPDEDKCKELSSRTGSRSYTKDVRSILTYVRSLKTRSRLSVVVCAKMEDILSDEEVWNTLYPELRAAVCTFSAQFVPQEVRHVSSCGVPVYGCFYAYDGVDVGKHAVNSCGVLMKRTSQSSCEVQWGGDRRYTEPYTTTQAFRFFMRVEPAVSFVPGSKSANGGAKDIFSRVFVVLPE